MPRSRELDQSTPEHQATLLEAELDSLTFMLGQMKAKVQKDQLLEHLTSTERTELAAALTRAEGRIHELLQAVRPNV